jgi:hypothetical protein
MTKKHDQSDAEFLLEVEEQRKVMGSHGPSDCFPPNFLPKSCGEYVNKLKEYAYAIKESSNPYVDAHLTWEDIISVARDEQ